MLEIVRSLLIGLFAIVVLLPVIRFAMRRLLTGAAGEKLTPEEQRYMQKKEWRLTLAYFFFTAPHKSSH